MSADTHTGTPIRGVPGHGSGDLGRNSQHPVVSTDDPSGDAARNPTATSPQTDRLTWNRDSSVDLPAVERRQPRLRQLMGVCGWAALLGVVGLVVGIRGFIGDLVGAAPDWYEPAMIAVGFIGIALTVGAFITVQRRRMPYALLGGATVVLVYAMTLTATAF